MTDVRADLPGDLARVIRRCLEKDPRHRANSTSATHATPTPDSRAARAGEGL
jgi:hypothetical protein